MRISDWSSDVCSSDLQLRDGMRQQLIGATWETVDDVTWRYDQKAGASILTVSGTWTIDWDDDGDGDKSYALPGGGFSPRSEEHTSELQSLMRISYAVFCLKKKIT